MKKILIKTCTLIIVIITILIAIFCVLQKKENNDYLKRGVSLIDKIETFRQIEKRLPDNFNELGLEEPMNEGPYYEKKDSINYIVFFNIGFDNVKIYYSDKKEWKDEH
jgi:hypothetical protein